MTYNFYSGIMLMGCLAAGFFFLKFWRRTYDRLFYYFSISFFILAFERLVLAQLGIQNEISPLIYLIRLSAFLLIIFAIINKNKESKE
jgi:uncharacterized membrane protein